MLSAVAAEPHDKTLSQTFSFSQKLFASAGQRLDRLDDIPRRSVAILLNQQWIFPLNLGDPLSRERGLVRKTWELNVPSSSKLLDSQCVGLQGYSSILNSRFR
jgi:hypothetical protein